MKKLILLTIFFIMGLVPESFSQTDVRDYIENYILETFVDIIPHNPLYVVDDVYMIFNPESVEEIDIDDIRMISCFRNYDDLLFPEYRTVVYIVAKKQRKKYMKRSLELARGKYSNAALTVDGKFLDPYSGNDFLSGIKAKEIRSVDIIPFPVNTENYGSAGENGLVLVKLKK